MSLSPGPGCQAVRPWFSRPSTVRTRSCLFLVSNDPLLTQFSSRKKRLKQKTETQVKFKLFEGERGAFACEGMPRGGRLRAGQSSTLVCFTQVRTFDEPD